VPYQVIKDSEGIIVVNYQGTVNLAERMAVVEDACVQIDDVKKAILLIDVRGIKVDMTIEEQKKFGQYLPSRAELKQRHHCWKQTYPLC